MRRSGKLAVTGDDGELELELGSNGGSKEEKEIREEEENRGGEWIGEALGSLSPSSPVRGGGQAGTQVRGRAGEGGGPLLLLLARGRRRRREVGRARLGDR